MVTSCDVNVKRRSAVIQITSAGRSLWEAVRFIASQPTSHAKRKIDCGKWFSGSFSPGQRLSLGTFVASPPARIKHFVHQHIEGVPCECYRCEAACSHLAGLTIEAPP